MPKRILKAFSTVSIRNRLQMALLLMILIPTIAFGIVSVFFGMNNGYQQVEDQLTSVAVLKEAEIELWVKAIRSDLLSVILESETSDHMCSLLFYAEAKADAAVREALGI